MNGSTKFAMLTALALLGQNTFTATEPHVEPLQGGRRAIKSAAALRKAQDKRDRKSAKRLLNEQFRKVTEDKIIT